MLDACYLSRWEFLLNLSDQCNECILEKYVKEKMLLRSLRASLFQIFCEVNLQYTGFDLSGCPGGIHALKYVRPTQD